MTPNPHSALLRQLFIIQDQQRITNKELGYRSGMLGNIISRLRTGQQNGTIVQAEKIAAALGYEVVLRPRMPGDRK